VSKPIISVLFTAFAAVFSCAAFAVDAPGPSLKEASLVTEVLPWGETVTAVRIEYSEEIPAAELTSRMPTQTTDSSLVKFHLFADRAISSYYVNNSGKKDDVAVYGRYVFLNLGIQNMDANTYRSQVTFNPATKTRPRLPGYVLSQTDPITTRTGKVIEPVTVSTKGEIAVGIDDYTTFTFKNEATGHTLNYHLYIPRGYEAKKAGLKDLPLVVHYPSGDFNYVDWTGKYRGALFSHHDALYWSDEDSQAAHPAFVVTVGGAADPKWNSVNFSDSEMQQNLVKVVEKILAEYNVDASRIYAVSLAGGSTPMWSTIQANPGLFAAQISTSYDTDSAYKDEKVSREKFAEMLKILPGWFFAGLMDPTGLGALGPSDKRYKGERLRDTAEWANQNGFHIDIGYGKDGEWMWNGLLRGEKASRMAEAQLARARAENAVHLITIYIPGTLLINQHWSWDATYSNAVVRNWLFEHVNKTPYTPGK
jgi:predicted peptidase